MQVVMLALIQLGTTAAATAGGLPAAPYTAASNVRRLFFLQSASPGFAERFAVLRRAATSAPSRPGSAPLLRPPHSPRLQGGWFDKEVKKKPAGGKQPHITFILFDD